MINFKGYLDSISGVRVVSSYGAITTILVQRRTHRKNRLNKKYGKRLGFDTVTRPTAFLKGTDYYVHPDLMRELLANTTENK